MEGITLEEKAVRQYAEMVIARMEKMKLDWHKPWVGVHRNWHPQNIAGRRYNGLNNLLLGLYGDMVGYQTPVFATFKNILDAGAAVKRGEKGFPITYYEDIIRNEEGKKVPRETYNAMTDAEREMCKEYHLRRFYVVFNIEQSNFPELKPEAWEEMKKKFNKEINEDKDMFREPLLDYMIENGTWLCPVRRSGQDRAFYSPANDEITVPLKGQFDTGECFYGTLLHEMAHSTGASGRLNRDIVNLFGTHAYGREELVAELTSAVTASSLGISKGLDKDNVAYLQSWIDAIREKPEFLMSVLSDVTKAGNMILSNVDNEDVRRRIREDYMDLAKASFPFHALDTYLPKLIRAGERVAICDQLEAPQKNNMRGVIELFTPGITGQGQLKEDNNLLSNKINKEEIFMARNSNDAQEQTENKSKKTRKAVKEATAQEQKPDGAWVSKLQDKQGNKINGLYGVFKRENGVVSGPKRLSQEDKDFYFAGTAAMDNEEKSKVFKERAGELAKAKFSQQEDEQQKKLLADGYHLKSYVDVKDGAERKVYFLIEVQNGEASKRMYPDAERLKRYFEETKGLGPDVRKEKIAELGKEFFPNGFEPKEECYKLPVLDDGVKARINDAYIAKGEKGYYIKATIDGIDRLGKPLDPEKDKAKIDAYFRHFSDLPEMSDERAAAKKEAAMSIASEKAFYGHLLEKPAVKEKNGVSR